ncbi:hypothetical protein AB0395_06605 [Streptosporangium sp. NPDC051023]|uniref:hypothetical protein n=1 Tax=Streptosporangium sp. NPDC051023 TaxID=3155410 RepID=UPI00344E93A7
MRISASPSPAVIWPRGSRGDLVEQALLQRFRNARTLDRKPPEAAPFTSGRITVMGETQIGAAAVGHPECRRWSQGVWSVAGSLRDEPGGVLGAVFLIDTTKGPFAGPTLSESITYASDAALRRLSAADPPAECRTIRMSDGRTSWTKRYHRVAPPDLPGGQAQAYLLRDESGTVPPTWVALTRYGDYLIEVRLVVRPVTDDVASQRAMLAELLRQAHARAASTLR